MSNIMIQEISKTQIESYSTINDRFSYSRSELLGKGASASVYLGYDRQKDKQIAVKHVPLEQYNKSRSAFERELQAMRRLKHPNIIEYYGQELDKYDGLYIFLELCQQKSLDICIMEQLREEESLRLFSQLVEGMAYMNNHKIIHRDLKPSNLLLSLSGDLKIADFGECRELEQTLNVRYTLQRVGTPYYSSPEYQQGQPYNEISDVYSAGYILYQMLTREKIMDRDIKRWKAKYQGQENDFDGDQMIRLIRNIVKEKINQGGWKLDHPTLSAKSYWLPILYRMLELNPSCRASFQDVKLMLKDVHPTGALPVVRTITESEQQGSQELRRRVELWLRFCEYQNNRWLWIFDMLKKPQLFSLEKIPKLYQLLFLYFSLLFYCKDLSQLSHNLANRDTDLFIEEDLFGPIFEAMTVTGKLKVTEIMDKMVIGINTLRENARRVLEKIILPDFVKVSQLQGPKPEMMVLEELQLSIKIMANRQKREEESMLFLANKFSQLLGYLYRTDSQLQTMATNDIRSYFILLLVGNWTRSESKSEEVEQFRRFSNEKHLSFKWIGSLERLELLEMSMQTKRGKAKSWKKKKEP